MCLHARPGAWVRIFLRVCTCTLNYARVRGAWVHWCVCGCEGPCVCVRMRAHRRAHQLFMFEHTTGASGTLIPRLDWIDGGWLLGLVFAHLPSPYPILPRYPSQPAISGVERDLKLRRNTWGPQTQMRSMSATYVASWHGKSLNLSQPPEFCFAKTPADHKLRCDYVFCFVWPRGGTGAESPSTASVWGSSPWRGCV